jgi:4-hydroxy-3-methylbut-2-enyl diphosphate reductase
VAQQSDCVVIVGSANSSNSVRLMEVAQEGLGERGKAYRVDDASELDPAWFEGLESVGISSGASVPDELVSGVIDALQNLGFTGMKSVETIKENMHFVLPAELRRKK